MAFYRVLDLTLISAKDLKDVNLFSKMDVYAVVSLSSDPENKQKTGVDQDCGSNPKWNFPMRFSIDESYIQHQNLVIKIKTERTLGSDKEIGEVFVPIKELLEMEKKEEDKEDKSATQQFVNYQVRKPSGKPKGTLNFSFKFGEKMESVPKGNEILTAYPTPLPHPVEPIPGSVPKTGDEPVTAYPPPSYPAGSSSGYPTQPGAYPAGPYPYPPPQQPAYGYPPAPQGYGYPPQQQPGYGYPPAGQPGYGYPPVQQQQEKKKNKFGMGLGAGLVGGAIGGLLIGDMVSDAADFDDAGDMGDF